MPTNHLYPMHKNKAKSKTALKQDKHVSKWAQLYIDKHVSI